MPLPIDCSHNMIELAIFNFLLRIMARGAIYRNILTMCSIDIDILVFEHSLFFIIFTILYHAMHFQ